MPAQTNISAEEINLLVHSYLQDSGFVHAAFAFAAESKLTESPSFTKPIHRGQLVELLIKSLRYVEVETHLRGDILNDSCKAPFSLLTPHECSPDAKTGALAAESAGDKQSTWKDAEAVLQNQKDPSKRPQMVKQGQNSNAMDVDTPNKPIAKASPSTPLPVLVTPSGVTQTKKSRTVNPIFFFPKLHESEVFSAVWHPTYKDILATGTREGKVRIWQVPQEGKLPKIPVEISFSVKGIKGGDITGIAFHPTQKILGVACFDTVLRMYDVWGKLLWSGEEHKGPLFAAKWHPKRNIIITASLDGCVGLWSHDQKSLVRMYPSHKGYQCCDVEWLDQDYFMSCGSDGATNIMHIDKPGILRSLSSPGSEITLVRCHENLIATACDNGTSCIYDISRPVAQFAPILKHELKGHFKGLSGIRWCPVNQGQNPILATCDFEGNIKLWDGNSGKMLHHFKDQKLPVFALNFSPDGRYLVAGGQHGLLMFYDTKTYKKAWEHGFHPCIFEAEWQVDENSKPRWLSLALSNKKCVVIDVQNIPQLYP